MGGGLPMSPCCPQEVLRQQIHSLPNPLKTGYPAPSQLASEFLLQDYLETGPGWHLKRRELLDEVPPQKPA